MTDLKRLLVTARDFTVNSLIDEGEPELLTMFHLIGPDDNSALVATPWRNPDEKMMSLAAVKKIAHQMHAVAAMFVGEVWYVDRPLGPTNDMDPPSQQPDRKEAVMALAMDNEGNSESARWDIIRDKPGGKIVSLGRPQYLSGGFSGRIFDGMLPPKR